MRRYTYISLNHYLHIVIGYLISRLIFVFFSLFQGKNSLDSGPGNVTLTKSGHDARKWCYLILYVTFTIINVVRGITTYQGVNPLLNACVAIDI